VLRAAVDRAGFTYAGMNLEVDGVLGKTSADEFKLSRGSDSLLVFTAGSLKPQPEKQLKKAVRLVLASGPQRPCTWQDVKRISN